MRLGGPRWLAPRLLGRLTGPGTLATVARGAGLAFVLQASGAGLGFVTQVLLARWMGVSDYGTYAYTIAWASLLAIVFGLGLGPTAVRFIARYSAQNDWGRLRGFIRAALLVTAGAGLAAALVGSGIVLALHAAGVVPAWQAPVLGVLLAAALSLLTLHLEMSRGVRRVGLAYAPAYVARPVLVIAGALAVSAAGRLTSERALLVTLVVVATIVVVQNHLFRRGLPPPVAAVHPTFELSRWLAVAFPLLLIAGFATLLRYTDLLMVGAFLGADAAGLYGAASQTAVLVTFVLLAVNGISAPMFAAFHAEQNRGAMQDLASTAVRWIFWPSLALAAALVVLSDPILALFGGEFGDARWPLVVLAVGQLANAAAGSVTALLSVTGHQKQVARVFGVVAATNVAANAVGIILFGLVGAAIATAASTVLWNVWLHTLARRELAVDPSIVSAAVRRRWA